MSESPNFWKLLRFFGTCLTLFITSCSRTPINETCLPSLTPISFPSGSIPAETSSVHEVVPKSWIPVLAPEQIQSLQIRYVNSMAVRSSNEIWFVINGPKPLQVARYLVQPREIATYRIELPSGESYVPGKVYLSRTGEIWGINPVDATPGLKRENYLLSRYDDTSDKFLPFDNTNGIQLGGWKINDIDSDHKGNLWLVVDGTHNGNAHNILVKVDVQKNKAIKIEALDPFDIISLTIDDRDRVWLFARTSESINTILLYDIISEKLTNYGTPPVEETQGDTQGLFIEDNNRLWVSNRAWLDLGSDGKGVWYTVILPAAFVAPSADALGGITYQWWYDSPMIEDHRGRLWFGYPAVVYLDPSSEEWCLVHRASGVTAKDELGTIWIFSGSQLYKYPK